MSKANKQMQVNIKVRKNKYKHMHENYNADVQHSQTFICNVCYAQLKFSHLIL